MRQNIGFAEAKWAGDISTSWSRSECVLNSSEISWNRRASERLFPKVLNRYIWFSTEPRKSQSGFEVSQKREVYYQNRNEYFTRQPRMRRSGKETWLLTSDKSHWYPFILTLRGGGRRRYWVGVQANLRDDWWRLLKGSFKNQAYQVYFLHENVDLRVHTSPAHQGLYC